MNFYAEEASSKNHIREVKLFEKSKFIAGYALLIRAYYCYWSGSILFSTPKIQRIIGHNISKSKV